MQKFTITQVTADKSINTKYGAKLKQSCKFKETGDIWHGIWGGGKKVGDVVEGTRESREFEGKIYWDFKFPKKDEVQAIKQTEMDERLRKIEFRLGVIEDHLKAKAKSTPEDEPYDYPENDINPEDVPF